MRATQARSGSAWRAAVRPRPRRVSAKRLHTRKRKLYTGPLIVISLIVIEALLATRIAGQATSQDPNWWVFGALLSVTDLLVAPFRDIQPEPSFKETGVVEFATLVALEAYLVAALALIGLIQITRISAWFVRRARRTSTPPLTLMEPVLVEPTAAIPPQESSQAA